MPKDIAGELGLDRRTLAAQLYSALESKILSGELAPGSRLSEDSLAEAYRVSRSPAREALAGLERVGLAERVGPRDRIITIPTEELIAQKFDLWWIIDGGRTYLSSLNATPADHAELRTYLDRMARAVKTGNRANYLKASAQFHEKIRGGCRNQYVNQCGADCDLYLKWFETLYDRSPEFSNRVVEEHNHILDAYERRDLPALYETIRPHLIRQRERILAFFSVARRNVGPSR